MMYKVLMVVPALGAVYGGPSLTAIGLAEGLGHAGLKVDVVTTNADGEQNLDVLIGTWINQAGYRVRYFERLGTSEYKFSLSLLRWLWRHVCDYDIVHGTSIFNFPAFAYSAAAQLRGVPFVVNPQGMLEPWAMAHKAWKKRLYFEFLERPRLKAAAAIHCLTKTEADNVCALGLSTPLVIVPNGVSRKELDAPSVGPEPLLERFPELRGKTLILFLHRVDPKKGLDLLAIAFANTLRSLPHLDLHLVVAGPPTGHYLALAESYFAEAGCSQHVTFTDMLTGEMKRAALAAADVFVTPTYSEGFSMSVLEAMAAGLPNVMTTGCNFPEADVAGVARIVEIDAGAFGRALIEVLANPAEAKAMGTRARSFVRERYSWDAAARRTVAIYRAILGEQRLPFALDTTSPQTDALA